MSYVRFCGFGHRLTAVVLIALGAVGVLSGDFAGVWQEIPIHSSTARSLLAYIVAIGEVVIGYGLFLQGSAGLASWSICIFSGVWLLSKVPDIFLAPSVEANWLGFGEIGVVLCGAFCSLAPFVPERKRDLQRAARILLAICLPMIGLSHFAYSAETAQYIPSWIPFPKMWVYITGMASLVAALAILTGLWARLATLLEAVMLLLITIAVWVPGLIQDPINRNVVVPFLVSLLISASVLVVADSFAVVAPASIDKDAARARPL